MHTPTLLQQVRVLDPLAGTDRVADVRIDGGIVRAIGPGPTEPPEAADVLPAGGCILAPGLVDLYSHSGEPGHEERETLASLIASATAGGFTRVAILPDTLPPLDHPALFTTLQRKSQELQSPASTRLEFWATLTRAREGGQMTEFADLLELTFGFTDGRGIEDTELIRRLLEYLKPHGRPIALFPVNYRLRGPGVAREGDAAIRLGLPGDPALSETTALAELLELIEETGTPVHISRVSTRRGVGLIGEAKRRGVPVTASVTWLHLLLNTEAIATFSPSLRLDPPLGNESDREALVGGIRSGTLDAIAVDHRPHTHEEKTVAFAEAPPGAIGLELALPLLWEKLVVAGELSPLELWGAMSVKPCLCTGQSPPTLEVGQKAEAILFDPTVSWRVDGDTLHSLSRATFWLDRSLSGRVLRMWNYR